MRLAQRSRHAAMSPLNLFSDKKNVAMKHLTQKTEEDLEKQEKFRVSLKRIILRDLVRLVPVISYGNPRKRPRHRRLDLAEHHPEADQQGNRELVEEVHRGGGKWRREENPENATAIRIRLKLAAGKQRGRAEKPRTL
jgi:hypothetical protein